MKDDNLAAYKRTLKQAAKREKDIKQIIKEVTKEEIKSIYLVGCGGSLACMYPCEHILTTESTVAAKAYNASEFLTLTPAGLTDKAVVILSSYSGETTDTVKAARQANKKGAITIGFSAEDDSSLAEEVDHIIISKMETDDTNAKLVILYQIIFNILSSWKKEEKYMKVLKSLSALPGNIVKIKKTVEQEAAEFARRNKDEDFFMAVGAGICWGPTYYFATFSLEEMQWICAQPVHAGEYFHGPFEIVREDTNLVILKGEDCTRALLERAEEFSRKYSDYTTVIDTKNYQLAGIAENLRGYFSPFILSAVLDSYTEKLAVKRDHPLETRKYMGKVDY